MNTLVSDGEEARCHICGRHIRLNESYIEEVLVPETGYLLPFVCYECRSAYCTFRQTTGWATNTRRLLLNGDGVERFWCRQMDLAVSMVRSASRNTGSVEVVVSLVCMLGVHSAMVSNTSAVIGFLCLLVFMLDREFDRTDRQARRIYPRVRRNIRRVIVWLLRKIAGDNHDVRYVR